MEHGLSLDLVDHFDTPAELLARAKHRPRRVASLMEPVTADPRGWGDVILPVSLETQSSSVQQPPKRVAAKAERARNLKYSELAQREERHRKMSKTLERINLEKALLGKGRVKKMKPKEGEMRRFKWRQERKR